LHEGHIAFPVRDGAGSVIAAHYRQKRRIVALLSPRRKGASACHRRISRR
jgi:hypothetical protein